MKAVRYHEYGPADVLRYEDVDVPEPGPGEVRVRVEACGVNHFDVDLRAGVSRWPLPMPHQLGVEFAGTVDAVGDGVEHLAVGDGVWPQHEVECNECRYCRAGQPNLCLHARMMSVQFPGGYAEQVIAPAHATHLLPDGVTAEMAAAGQVVFTTAWHMIVTRATAAAGRDRRRPGRGERHRPRRDPGRRASTARASSRPPAPTTSSRAPASWGRTRRSTTTRTRSPSASWR